MPELPRPAALALALLGACAQPVVPVVPDPVPPADKLRPSDCVAYAQAYQRLAFAAQAGGRTVAAIEDPEGQCRSRLAGPRGVRRAILHCWNDSQDLKTFLSCNDRF